MYSPRRGKPIVINSFERLVPIEFLIFDPVQRENYITSVAAKTSDELISKSRFR